MHRSKRRFPMVPFHYGLLAPAGRVSFRCLGTESCARQSILASHHCAGAGRVSKEVQMIRYTRSSVAVLVVFFTFLFASVAVQAQSGHVTLWNTLGSDTEITNSQIVILG